MRQLPFNYEEALVRLIGQLAGEDNFEEAVFFLDRLILYQPNDPAHYNLFGEIIAKTGKTASASRRGAQGSRTSGVYRQVLFPGILSVGKSNAAAEVDRERCHGASHGKRLFPRRAEQRRKSDLSNPRRRRL
jgi:hypothetical protein